MLRGISVSTFIFSSVIFLPAKAQQSTNGFCSPAINNVTGNVTTNCYSTESAWRQSIDDNLRETTFVLSNLMMTQSFYMLPSLQEYIDRPSEASWMKAKNDVDLVRSRLTLAIDAAVRYNSSIELGPSLQRLHSALRSRGGLLSELPRDPPSPQFLQEWVGRYRQQMQILVSEIQQLRSRLPQARRS